MMKNRKSMNPLTVPPQGSLIVVLGNGPDCDETRYREDCSC